MTRHPATCRLRSRARRLATLGVAALAALTGGCASTGPGELEMMPTPAAYEQADAPFGAVSAGTGDSALIEVLYATSRAVAGANDEEPYYSGQRGYLVRTGSARVALGDATMSWDRARQISLLKSRPGQFPLRVTGVTELGVIPDSVSVLTPVDVAATVDQQGARRFADQIEERLGRSDVKDVFIYVHGYKVPFENPLLVASELWHFLGYEGAFIAFSWPSTPERLAYLKDIETARVSAWGLRKLIEYLARETSAERIHLIGYSAGTRLVLTTLYELALIHRDTPEARIPRSTRLGNVILLGSDVDTGLFASYLLDGLLQVQDRLTLYSSAADQALGLSALVFRHRRMGEVLPGTLDARMREFVAATARLAVIDVTGAANFEASNGHAYFRKSPWVSSDILITLRYGLAPEERGLVRSADSPIWRFPADYVPRFEAALEQANPQLGGRLDEPRAAAPAPGG